MRISDWSSDVCSSDLLCPGRSGYAPESGGRSTPNAPSGEFEERGYAVGRDGFDARPAIGTEPFEGAEPRLVGHARRSFDPITEIDIGKDRKSTRLNSSH